MTKLVLYRNKRPEFTAWLAEVKKVCHFYEINWPCPTWEVNLCQFHVVFKILDHLSKD